MDGLCRHGRKIYWDHRDEVYDRTGWTSLQYASPSQVPPQQSWYSFAAEYT